MTAEQVDKAARAVMWNAAGTFGNRALQFATTVALARLLSPAEFGMVAVLAIFTYLATALIESRFGSALIQMQAVAREDESAVFHFNLAMAGLLYAIFWFLADPIARFYGQPELVPLARVLALVFFCNALGLVHGTLLTKQLNFRLLARAQLEATVASGSLGILLGCAAGAFGAWRRKPSPTPRFAWPCSGSSRLGDRWGISTPPRCAPCFPSARACSSRAC